MKFKDSTRIFVSERLRELYAKLRCIGSLIEDQDPRRDPPLDLEDVDYGFGLLLREICIGMGALANMLDGSSEPKEENQEISTHTTPTKGEAHGNRKARKVQRPNRRLRHRRNESRKSAGRDHLRVQGQ